jgi:hypothetical protein
LATKLEFLDKLLVRFVDLELWMRDRAKVLALLVPGCFLVILSLSLIFFPKLALICLAFFFLALGSIIIWAGYKLNQLRRKFGKISAQIEAKLMLDPSVLAELQRSGFSGLDKQSYTSAGEGSFKERVAKARQAGRDSSKADLTTELLVQLGDSKKITYH